jgi:hypothetical protein
VILEIGITYIWSEVCYANTGEYWTIKGLASDERGQSDCVVLCCTIRLSCKNFFGSDTFSMIGAVKR